MKKYRLISILTLWLVSSICAFAQEVLVTVVPTQQVLPPQVLLYLSDPGKYFTVTLTNTTPDVQQVYLGLQLEQIIPASDLAIVTPPKRQPQKPFVIQANSVYTLSSLEMKNLFNHIPASEIKCPSNLFDDYASGAFGLLPEGTYRSKITAYRWSSPALQSPVVVSNPESGACTFQICYKAQAPQFLTPMYGANSSESVATVDPLNAQFTWTMPTIACGATASFTYDIKFVELLPGQNADVAMDRNPVVYQVKDLMPNMCVIPMQVISGNFFADKTYLAQVTAQANSSSPLSYVMLENNGKSTFLPFKFKNRNENKEEEKKDDNEEDEKKDDDNKKDDDKGDDDGDDDEELLTLWGKYGVKDDIDTTALYNFSNPTITSPTFDELAARKKFLRSNMTVDWREVMHLGGTGTRPDTLRFEYEVQLFNGENTIDKLAALESEPIYSRIIKDTEQLTDTIFWNKIEDKVKEKDYLVLRVKPICTNCDSVKFYADSLNVVDYALVEFLTKKYFQCSDMVELENEEPTTAKADELKGKTIAIGEYQLTIDEIKEGEVSGTWEGKGKVEWNVLGTKIMVCVKFTDLKINTDLVVIGGTAQSYSKDPESNNEIVEKLFSDWGIDNLISDTGIPYADQLQSAATDGVKSLAEKLDLSKYYEYVVAGQNVWNAIGKQNIDELYMPMALPESITDESPVNVQITTMKFAATHATMDLIGEFVIPDCDVMQDQILVFGAPHICISPDRILPESGTLALLSNLTLTDPDSDFECTFKAPRDVLNPTDGCYVSWHADKFELLGIDVDMKIPGLKKDINGVAQEECPVFNIRTSIGSWDDWMVDNISIDPFQAEDLPGWTFTAKNIVYDHSFYRNSPEMGKFPTKYDQSRTLVSGQINTWQGLYIKEIGVKMPKSLEFGTSDDKRLAISTKNMFFDDSGVSLEIEADDILSAKTGKAGGWAFSLDKVHATFIQNDFNECGFSGKFDVPLLDGQLGYACQILKVNNLKNSKAGNYAYVFKVQQVDSLNMDFILATAEFDKQLSYMLVEAVPEEDKLKTRVELLLSGDLSIGGDAMKEQMASLPIEIDLPDIHFSKMRLANCPVWESQFEDIKEMQTATDDTKKLVTLYKGKEYNINDKFYFNTGEWSLASMAKKIGPFEFSIDEYQFDFKDELLSLSILGGLKFIDGIDLSAKAGVTISARLSGLSSVTSDFDFSKIDFEYDKTTFDKAEFNSSFAGMTLTGELIASDDEKYGKGYKGTLSFTMPGDLFTANATGGYFKLDDYKWGYFYAAIGSSYGIPIPPVTITDISAGFYFNCVRKSETEAEPKKGIIGVVAGMGLYSSAGKDLMGGNFEMTVVYNKENKRLTTFMLTGHLSAVSDLIKSKATIVYQEDDIDKYFALNITVDAKADNVGGISDEMTALSGNMALLQRDLNPDMEEPVSDATGGLEEAFNDQSESKADEETNAKTPEAPKVGEGFLSLDLRITMKENGKKLDKVKWHLYLGEPDEDKRCKFILVDFKSKIVSVNVGANAYLCIGNELPGDGELPPIPDKIREFLDGSTKGSGVESADISKANNARTAALKNFQAEVAGGVMMGASAWGYIDFNLGLFYGDLGALAGFDVSIRKLSNASCMNIPRTPGFNGWYAEGQLYAYLYAKFGIHINLGFWDKKLDIIDAGIGGVLRMGLPNPSYFTGEARVKLNLLAGLVKINRKFEFECGDRCDIFYGNALDNFKLFGECSIGDTIQAKGWNEENAINPNFYKLPYVDTEAPVDEHFRVLDETELNRLAQDFSGDKEQLKAQASRTFVFKKNAVVTINEYSSPSQNLSYPNRTLYFAYKGTSRFRHQIDMMKLNPNKFYRMCVTGTAKEIENGQEVNPLKWNEDKRKYENVAWEQTKYYYFCTGAEETLDDCPEDLQEYVAIAYPSYYNQIKQDKETVNAYCSDIKSPNIAFLSDISQQAFQNGVLRWKLEKYNSGNWQLVEEKDATWVVSDSTCNLAVSGGQFDASVSAHGNYRLQLNYYTSRTETQKVAVWDLSGRKAVLKLKDKTVIVIDTTNVANLKLMAVNGYYHMGYRLARRNFQADYEKPFVGIRLNTAIQEGAQPTISGKELSYYKKFMAKDGVNPLRYQDPYIYITYMSNYGLVGGWTLTNNRLTVNATTAQSLIYYDRGGAYEGRYSGDLGDMKDYIKVRRMSIYDRTQWKKDCLYPLPQMDDSKYNYAFGGRERAYKLNYDGSDDDNRAAYVIQDIYAVYDAVDRFDSLFRRHLQQIMGAGTSFSTEAANNVRDLMESNTGVYITAGTWLSPNVRIEVPYYQLGILWGSQFKNSGSRKAVTMWGQFDDIPDWSRPQEERCEDILLGLVGNNNYNLVDINYDQVITGKDSSGKYTYATRAPYIDFVPQWDYISEINVTMFRVNAFNFKKAEYTVSENGLLNKGPRRASYTYTITNPSKVLTNTGNVNNYLIKNQ